MNAWRRTLLLLLMANLLLSGYILVDMVRIHEAHRQELVAWVDVIGARPLLWFLGGLLIEVLLLVLWVGGELVANDRRVRTMERAAYHFED